MFTYISLVRAVLWPPFPAMEAGMGTFSAEHVVIPNKNKDSVSMGEGRIDTGQATWGPATLPGRADTSATRGSLLYAHSF